MANAHFGYRTSDSDQDGIPDEWELAHGLDPHNAADGAKINADGYSNLENYMNSLVAHITEAQNLGGQLEGFTESYPKVADDVHLVERHEGRDWLDIRK